MTHSALGYWMIDYVYDDHEDPEHMEDEDAPYDLPTQKQHSVPGTTDIRSASYLAPQLWENRFFDAITRLSH